MDEQIYVPFEPGIGMQRVWTPRTAALAVVDAAPAVAAVETAEADAWFERPTIENLSDVRTRQAADPPTRVAAMRDGRFLFVAFECLEPAMDRTHRLVPADAEGGRVQVVAEAMPRTMAYDEHVAIYLDGAHDKTTYYQMKVSINGARTGTRRRARMSWTAMAAETSLETGDLRWESAVCERGDRWRAAIRVDMESIGLDPRQPTVGANFVRGRNVDWMRHYSWTDIIHPNSVPGLALGDLYLGDHGAAVRRIDFGDLETGPNRVSVTLAGGSAGCTARLNVRVADPDGADIGETHSPAVELPAAGEAELAADFDVPFDCLSVCVTLEAVDAGSGGALYRATWPLSNHANMNVNQPYARSRTDAPAPAPDDPDFHHKKLRWVLSRLPKFCRRTTAQGAPSDFTLAGAGGEPVFNLMQAGALKRIADWICTLFEDDNDRLIAVALLTNDDWITTHAAVRVGMHWQLTPLSLLRLGTGHCYSRAVVGAGIAAELPDPATGANHQAWPTLVLGHVITAIRRGDDYVFIDPTFGHFFFNRDNTDLATATELAADTSLVTRVARDPKRLRNYASTAGHVRIATGPIVWPAGAPPR